MARHESVCVLISIVLLLCAGTAAGAGSDWPMWRRDPQNTGHSPVPGNMNRTPEILWKYFVGGYASQAQGLDIDGDGQDEVIYLSAGRIKAIDMTGDEIWATPALGISSIIETVDLGLDGSIEIIACRSSPSTAFVIDSGSGDVLWNHTFPSPSSGIGRYSVKVVDICNRTRGPELLIWPYKSELGYAFGFPDGAESGYMVWNATAPETRNYPPPIAVADLDLDGVKDLVLATYERIYSFDGETGQEKMVAYSPGINRNYGTMIISDLDQDPYPEIAVLSPNLNEHLWVVDNDGSTLTQIWNEHFEYSYPDDLIEVKVTVDCVSDVDSDGFKEIVYSIYNQSSDARWHTKIWDALTGTEEMDLVDEYLMAVVDLDGDGVDEVITSEQYGRVTDYYSNVSIRNIARSGEIRLYNCGLVMDNWAPYPLGTNTIANTEKWMTGDTGYLIRANGSLGFLIIEDWMPKIEWVLQENIVGAGLNILGTFNGTGILASGNDGWLRVFNASGQIVGMSKTGGFLASLVAADLDQDGLPEVLVKNNRGRQVLLDSDGTETAEFSAITRRAKCGKDGSLVVWDMDGDGRHEILAGGSSSLLVLDAFGNQNRSYPLPSNPYDWLVVNFTGDSYWDLCVSSLGSGPHTAYIMAIDGLSGEIIWEKDWGPYAGFMGVMDYDLDGLDDLLVREHFDFYIVIGPTGAEKKGKYLCGYHTPMVTDIEGDGTLEIVWGGGWGSLSVDRRRSFTTEVSTYFYITQIWVNLFGGGDSNEVYGKMPAVADLDGDGVMEVGVGNINGTFHCFGGSKGRLKWNYWVGSTPSDIISCDIDSDGLDEFLFGTSDGRLMSLGANGLEWSLDFGDCVGDPIICDLDGDSKADILVPVMDGNLYALHIVEHFHLMLVSAVVLFFGRRLWNIMVET